jgi:hypothetical protein
MRSIRALLLCRFQLICRTMPGRSVASLEASPQQFPVLSRPWTSTMPLPLNCSDLSSYFHNRGGRRFSLRAISIGKARGVASARQPVSFRDIATMASTAERLAKRGGLANPNFCDYVFRCGQDHTPKLFILNPKSSTLV